MFGELGLMGNLLILIVALFALNQASNLTIKHSQAWEKQLLGLFLWLFQPPYPNYLLPYLQ
jgi:hypothetical protein